MFLIILAIFIIYRVLKYKIELSHSKKIRTSNLNLILFNIFAGILAMVIYMASFFIGLNIMLVLNLFVYIMLILDICYKNKQYRELKEVENKVSDK